MKKIGETAFDFEAIYALYPRKGEGKKAGMLRLGKIIKTPDDYAAFRQAVQNYADLCRREGRQKQYIKHWKTFVNNWEDYVGPPQGGPVDQLRRIMENKL